MLKIKQFRFNPFGVSTFVAYDDQARVALVVDPGMATDAERKAFDDFIAAENLTIQQILNTHLHIDHCFGDNYVRDKYGVKVAAHLGDAPLAQALDQQASAFGVQPVGGNSVDIDVPLNDGDVITLGAYTFDVIHVPGHSRGGLVFYCPQGKFAFVGDSIFYGSIGRTDLYGGDHDTLIRSVRNKILTLPADTQLLPGHDRFTTVEREQRYNPYIR